VVAAETLREYQRMDNKKNEPRIERREPIEDNTLNFKKQSA